MTEWEKPEQVGCRAGACAGAHGQRAAGTGAHHQQAGRHPAGAPPSLHCAARPVRILLPSALRPISEACSPAASARSCWLCAAAEHACKGATFPLWSGVASQTPHACEACRVHACSAHAAPTASCARRPSSLCRCSAMTSCGSCSSPLRSAVRTSQARAADALCCAFSCPSPDHAGHDLPDPEAMGLKPVTQDKLGS